MDLEGGRAAAMGGGGLLLIFPVAAGVPGAESGAAILAGGTALVYRNKLYRRK